MLANATQGSERGREFALSSFSLETLAHPITSGGQICKLTQRAIIGRSESWPCQAQRRRVHTSCRSESSN